MYLIICCISNTIFWLFIINVNIKRLEKAFRQFYLPLRNEHPNDYIKQSKAIKFIRKHTGLSDYDNIHWVYSVLHYLQIILALGTSLVLSLGIITTIEVTIKIYIVFWVIVITVFNSFVYIFGFIQTNRCSKIKKTNSKYAQCEVFPWIK
jgi:hypothetical protein